MACCPGGAHDTKSGDFVWHSPSSSDATYSPAWSASFNEVNVMKDLPDGYWIEAFPFRTKPSAAEGPRGPELIAYGLGVEGKQSEIRMYKNPLHEMKKQVTPPDHWEYTVIKRFDFPVSLTYGKLRVKSDLNDIIICHDYGPSMDNLNMEGGIVSWLKNPGDRDTGDWKLDTIGKFPSMHRLKTGHFTQKEHLEVLALPIMTKSGDRETPAPVILYTPTAWDKADGSPVAWKSTEPLPDTFRLIHDVQVIQPTDGGLDRALIAGREGINLMWMDPNTKQWQHTNVGTGIPQSRRPLANPYWGSGSVATGRVGPDSVGYIASCEAFHGNLVSVYIKPRGTRPDKIVTSERWRRFVIDDFGPLKEKEFTGTIHHVQCADLDGSGVDSIIVACMGWPELDPSSPSPYMGTYVYKPVDLERGLFTRSKISDASAGRIALGDYRCSGTVDVATISYSVPNYLVTPNPALRVMLNNTANTRHAIKAQLLGDEVMIRVPRAASAEYTNEMRFLDIGGKKLSIVVLPPHREYVLGKGFKYQGENYGPDGVKVINGKLTWTSPRGLVTRGIAVDRYKAETLIPNATDSIVKAGDEGAIFIRLVSSISTSTPGLKFNNMNDMATVNLLPPVADQAARDITFPWVACNDREWGRGEFPWEFHNLVGFHVLYDGGSLTNICHIQAWTLGQGQTAVFHNHIDKWFCEIHACISNGTGKGGMWWGREDKQPAADDWLEKNKCSTDRAAIEEHAEHVVVRDMEEHGPLWRYNSEKLPKMRSNATVEYPWHAWLAGPKDDNAKEAYDVWLAFEFSPTEFQKDIPKHGGCAAHQVQAKSQ